MLTHQQPACVLPPFSGAPLSVCVPPLVCFARLRVLCVCVCLCVSLLQSVVHRPLNSTDNRNRKVLKYLNELGLIKFVAYSSHGVGWLAVCVCVLACPFEKLPSVSLS